MLKARTLHTIHELRKVPTADPNNNAANQVEIGGRPMGRNAERSTMIANARRVAASDRGCMQRPLWSVLTKNTVCKIISSVIAMPSRKRKDPDE
jgi:hypothetical protein